ncbi:zincin-like metallopeptidase domain-containing protein [Erythrobacter westpacificensis]|jgi:antirestriction protein ArdC|uniref:Zincin-like metallopeptidase domain-containing protein n=1 Tax=Erythrobacter westpacificensis TaxID=1055231 RepID=A0ABP9KQ50_9SPHN
MPKNTNRVDLYQAVTDDILSMLEAGTKPWAKPWSGGASIPLRHNGIPYRGINILSLWASAMRQGFASPYWLTFKQALELGGNVKKGSKGTTVVYANKLVIKDEETDDERRIPFLKRYTVFNAEQVEGVEGKYPPPPAIINNPDSRDDELEAMFGRIEADLRHGGSSAFYHIRDDYIQMPAFEAFHTGDDYYATLAHEATHWAGAESRLNRKTLTSTSRADYARDELVAELGAAFLGATIGFKVEEREDHAAYIEHWLAALRNDKRAIFEAAREAQNAADYLLAMMQEGGG